MRGRKTKKLGISTVELTVQKYSSKQSWIVGLAENRYCKYRETKKTITSCVRKLLIVD